MSDASAGGSVDTAVIVIGGLGSRVYPASYGVQKNLLPAGEKPIIQHAVEEALEAGVSKVVIVCNPGDDVLLRRHFRKDAELEAKLEKGGKTRELAAIRSIGNYVDRIVYVPQPQPPMGDGHAVLQAREAVGNRPFAVMFPDDFFYTGKEKGALAQMAGQYKKHGGNIFSVIEVTTEETKRYGTLKPAAPSEDGVMTRSAGVVEKPQSPEEVNGSRLAVMGRYILEPRAMDILADLKPDRTGEYRIAAVLDQLTQVGAKVQGQKIDGTRFDYGSLEGRMKAEASLAVLKDPSILAELQALGGTKKEG